MEAKVCRLAHGKDEEDVTEQQNAPQLRFTDPRTLNMEEYEGMGFDENNCRLIPPVNQASSQSIAPRPTSMPKLEDEQILNSSDPTHHRGKINRVNSFNTTQERAAIVLKNPKGGPFKSSGMKSQSQPSGSNQVESCRPQLNCTACGGCDHLRKDCHKDVFTVIAERDHTLWKCAEPHHNKPQVIFYVYIVVVQTTVQVDFVVNQMTTERNQGQCLESLEIRDRINYSRMGQQQVSHHQIRFNEGFNRQYSPNYINRYQSTIGSIPGQDLSTTLIELANIQSRSLEMMAASQRNQQEAFQELTRVSKDKSNDSMFTAIKTFDGTDRQIFEDWIDEVDQACRASNRGFRTELFKKSAGAVRQVILSCNDFLDDKLVSKLRSCFSHAPTMNKAREELHNM